MTRNIRPEQAFELPSERYWRQARKELAYVVSERFTVAAGSSINVHFKNPENTNRTAVFQAVELGTQFKGTLDVFDSFSSAPSNGTALQIENQIMDAEGTPDPGEMVANKNVDFTPDMTHIQSAFGSGAGAQSAGVIDGPSIFSLEDGREIVIEVTNETGTENKASLTLRYFEVESRLTNEL